MSCEIILNKSELTIVIEDNFLIDTLSEAHSELIDKIDDSTCVKIEALGCTELDSAAIQWLYAIRKHCASRDIPFQISSHTEALDHLLSLYSLEQVLKTGQHPQHKTRLAT